MVTGWKHLKSPKKEASMAKTAKVTYYFFTYTSAWPCRFAAGKNTKTTKKLASYGLLPSVRKMGFTSHFIYLTISHKTYVLTLFNIIFYFLFIYPTQHDPIYPLGPFLLRGYLIISLNSAITKCEMGVSKPFHSVK